MKKIDALLKKVEFFERMAVKGDRSSFLKSLAQDTSNQNAPTSYPGDVEADQKAAESQKRLLLQRAQTILQEAGAESKAIGDALLPLSGKPANMNAINADISNALLTGKLSPLSEQRKQLEDIKNKLFPSSPSAPTPKPHDYLPIDPQQQRALFQFVLDENLDPDRKILPTGKIEKTDIDGKLGRHTRAALEAVKNYFAKANPQNKRMSDQEAITAAKFPSTGKNQTRMV